MPSKITEVINVLNERHEILQLLAKESHSQQMINDQIEASQSTVSRTLNRLQEFGIVSKTENQYEFTLLGLLAYQKYTSYETEIEQLYSAEDILHGLQADVPLDPVVLEGSEITTSKPHVPDGALSPILRLTRKAINIKSLATMLHVGYIDTFRNEIENRDLEAEFILTDDVAEQSLKEHSIRGPPPVQTDRLKLYRTDADLPYSLLLIQTPEKAYTAIVVGKDTGTHGTIINTNEAAYEWAQDQYHQFKSDADPWEPPPKVTEST